jgi:hypothetical protein
MMRSKAGSSSSKTSSTRSQLSEAKMQEIIGFFVDRVRAYNPKNDLVFQKFKAGLLKTSALEGLGTMSAACSSSL